MNNLLLYLFVFIAICATAIMLFTNKVFYAALALLVCLLSVAAIYALLNAEFLAVTQLIIYAGGVLILVLFGIMLTNRISGSPLLTETQHAIPGIFIFVSLLTLLISSYHKSNLNNKEPWTTATTSIKETGVELMTTYVAPFELSGILLLVCLIGAAFTASSFKSE
jgi:NADH:ubiquinone oxidoreductase subunit 6 (subunit J)